MKKYNATYPIRLNKNRTKPRRKIKGVKKANKKGRSCGKQKKKSLQYFISQEEMAIDGECDSELHGVHQTEKKLIWKHFPFLLG